MPIEWARALANGSTDVKVIGRIPHLQKIPKLNDIVMSVDEKHEYVRQDLHGHAAADGFRATALSELELHNAQQWDDGEPEITGVKLSRSWCKKIME